MDGVGGKARFGRIVWLVGLGAICLALANCASSNMANRVEFEDA